MVNQYLKDLKKIEDSINELIYELQSLRHKNSKITDSIAKTKTIDFLEKHKHNINVRLKRAIMEWWGEDGYIEDLTITNLRRFPGIGKKSINEFIELKTQLNK